MAINTTRTGVSAQIGNVNASLMELNPGTDKVVEEVIVTTGYFTNNVGVILSSSFYTASNNASNDPYYVDVLNGAVSDAASKVQFSIAYGHYAGSGSDCKSGSGIVNNIKGPSQAIYSQFASMLLPETQITGGFAISSSGVRDEGIYVIVAERANMQDAVNRKNWTLKLSGSSVVSGTNAELHVTDDSVTNVGDPTMHGLRYNIVSGANGSINTPASTKNYGFFYPNLGVWVFSEKQLSSSISGEATTAAAVAMASSSQMGFNTQGGNTLDEGNALRMFNCINGNGSFQVRNEEVQQSVSWFCRVPSRFMNFSSNPTFISGTKNELRNKTMQGNPQVYITRIGLYNAQGEVAAVANLSSPLNKNFGTEATVKVKLTY